MPHTFKGDRQQDVRVEHPGRVSELSRAYGVRTRASGHEASCKSGKRERQKMLVILVLARPQKSHEAIRQLSTVGLDSERRSPVSRALHYGGKGLGIEPGPAGDARDPPVSKSREEGYARPGKPSSQGLSVDLPREVSIEATLGYRTPHGHLRRQAAVLVRSQSEPGPPFISYQCRALEVVQCCLRFCPGGARAARQVCNPIPHLRHGEITACPAEVEYLRE